MIFYITTHDANIRAAEKIKTLFANKNVEYYFVYGKEAKQVVEPCIRVDVEEAYENLPLKTYFLVEHFLKTEHQVMIKMDDDTYVDVDKLLENSHEEEYEGLFVNYTKSDKNSIYHWYKIKTEKYKIKKPSFDLSYAEGSLYYLNRKAAKAVCEVGQEFFKNVPESYIGEDIKVGMCLIDQEKFSRKDITKQWMPYYEISVDFSFVHPVHPILIDKLIECKTIEEKRKQLLKYMFLNDNLKREAYLNKELDKLTNEKNTNSCSSP